MRKTFKMVDRLLKKKWKTEETKTNQRNNWREKKEKIVRCLFLEKPAQSLWYLNIRANKSIHTLIADCILCQMRHAQDLSRIKHLPFYFQGKKRNKNAIFLPYFVLAKIKPSLFFFSPLTFLLKMSVLSCFFVSLIIILYLSLSKLH